MPFIPRVIVGASVPEEEDEQNSPMNTSTDTVNEDQERMRREIAALKHEIKVLEELAQKLIGRLVLSGVTISHN